MPTLHKGWMMVKPQKHHRNVEIAMIHIAKKELGLDDDTYRAVLWTCARVTSSKDLDFGGRKAVLAHFKARGWKSKPAAKSNTKIKLSLEDQHKMIRGLWLELFELGAVINSSEQSILRFVKNQTKIERMEWLSSKQASNLIEALKSWLAREQKKRAKNG
jgi:phage gp16-like protein